MLNYEFSNMCVPGHTNALPYGLLTNIYYSLNVDDSLRKKTLHEFIPNATNPLDTV